ncbi:hypothetical protein CYMTET_40419 [Cymbomonas tetramitiformis]|uniref:J domain-containing protein n=1 Tax=Cymbomonas tetramitiformis TaxID=36881 RepID=A0AAE0C843_9CHLO|nr:hypothetical protein CYMTET_40419 [Cymbomonas tetramitiformis]
MVVSLHERKHSSNHKSKSVLGDDVQRKLQRHEKAIQAALEGCITKELGVALEEGSVHEASELGREVDPAEGSHSQPTYQVPEPRDSKEVSGPRGLRALLAQSTTTRIVRRQTGDRLPPVPGSVQKLALDADPNKAKQLSSVASQSRQVKQEIQDLIRQRRRALRENAATTSASQSMPSATATALSEGAAPSDQPTAGSDAAAPSDQPTAGSDAAAPSDLRSPAARAVSEATANPEIWEVAAASEASIESLTPDRRAPPQAHSEASSRPTTCHQPVQSAITDEFAPELSASEVSSAELAAEGSCDAASTEMCSATSTYETCSQHLETAVESPLLASRDPPMVVFHPNESPDVPMTSCSQDSAPVILSEPSPPVRFEGRSAEASQSPDLPARPPEAQRETDPAVAAAEEAEGCPRVEGASSTLPHELRENCDSARPPSTGAWPPLLHPDLTADEQPSIPDAAEDLGPAVRQPPHDFAANGLEEGGSSLPANSGDVLREDLPVALEEVAPQSREGIETREAERPDDACKPAASEAVPQEASVEGDTLRGPGNAGAIGKGAQMEQPEQASDVDPGDVDTTKVGASSSKSGLESHEDKVEVHDDSEAQSWGRQDSNGSSVTGTTEQGGTSDSEDGQDVNAAHRQNPEGAFRGGGCRSDSRPAAEQDIREEPENAGVSTNGPDPSEVYIEVCHRIEKQVAAHGSKHDVIAVLAAFGFTMKTEHPELTEVQQGYRRIAMKFHPDRNVTKSIEEQIYAEEAWKTVSTAMDKFLERLGRQNTSGLHKCNAEGVRNAWDSKKGEPAVFRTSFASEKREPFETRFMRSKNTYDKASRPGPGFWRTDGGKTGPLRNYGGRSGGGRSGGGGIWD